VYCIPVLVPAQGVTELLETTKASVEHPAAILKVYSEEGRKDWGINCLPMEMTVNLTPLE